MSYIVNPNRDEIGALVFNTKEEAESFNKDTYNGQGFVSYSLRAPNAQYKNNELNYKASIRS